MSISHHCPRCGCSLRRLPAPADPVYGLAIVTCPECGRSSIRRLHPLKAAWQWFRRFDLVAGVLLLQVACAIAAVAGAWALVSQVGSLMDSRIDSGWGGGSGEVGGLRFDHTQAILAAGGAALVGVWVGVGLGHHGAVRAVGGFVCTVVLIALAAVSIDAFTATALVRASWLLAPGLVGVGVGFGLRRLLRALWPFWWRFALRRLRRSRRLT